MHWGYSTLSNVRRANHYFKTLEGKIKITTNFKDAFCKILLKKKKKNSNLTARTVINVTNWGCKLDSKLKVGLKTSKKKKKNLIYLYFSFLKKKEGRVTIGIPLAKEC